jgi:hypothetical protein
VADRRRMTYYRIHRATIDLYENPGELALLVVPLSLWCGYKYIRILSDCHSFCMGQPGSQREDHYRYWIGQDWRGPVAFVQDGTSGDVAG